MENLEQRIVLSCSAFPTLVATQVAGLQQTMDNALSQMPDAIPILGSAGELSQLETTKFLEDASDTFSQVGDFSSLPELENTLNQLFAPNVATVTPVNPGSPDIFEVDLLLGEALVTESTKSIALSTGLPGLPVTLEAGGSLDFTISYEYQLSFVYTCGGEENPDSMYFVDNDLPGRDYELGFILDVTLDNFEAEGTIGFVKASITDNGSSVNLALEVDNLHSSPDINVGGVAKLDLHVKAADGMFGYDDLFPSISTDLVLNWDLESGASPTADLTNIKVELGSYLGDMLEPIVDFVQPVLEPLQPIIEILKEPVPVISDLSNIAGGNDITYLELAGAVGGELPEGYKELVELSVLAAHIVDIVGDFDDSGGQLTLELGDVSLNRLASDSDLRSLSPALDPTQNTILQAGFDYESISSWTDIVDVEGIMDQVDQSDLPSSLKSSLNEFIEKIANGIDYGFPIIENPVFTVVATLMGFETDLFYFDGQAHINFDAPIFEATLPFGLDVGLKGSLALDAVLKAGYDTRGLRKFLETGKIEDISEGHYLRDDTKLNIGGSIEAYAGVDTTFFDVSVNGGLYAGIHVNMNGLDIEHEPDNNKVRYTENEVLFKVQGDLHAYLDIEVKIGVEVFGEFVGYTEEFNILEVPIWSFGSSTIPNPFIKFGEHKLAGAPGDTEPVDLSPDADPNIRRVIAPDGVLRLNVGSAAIDRAVESGETEETYVIFPWEDGSILVSAFGCSQQFFDVKEIHADFGAGQDKIFVAKGVDLPVVFTGGPDNDELRYAGLGTAILVGGDGDDKISGGDGVNTLIGDAGNDTLKGGDGPNNVLLGGPDNDILVGGRMAKNTLEGGPGNDELYAGDQGDAMDGGDGDDFFDTGPGGDGVICGDGDDRVTWVVGDGSVTVWGRIPTVTPDNQDRGMDSVGIAGTTAQDTFSIIDMGNAVIGGEMGHIVRVWHEQSDTGLQLVQVEGVTIHGGRGVDTITVGDLHQTLIREVGINLGDIINPDNNAEDVILIKGSDADDGVTVLTEEATLRVEGPYGGITAFHTPKYVVRIANEADSATLETYGGRDTVLVTSITGPTTIDTGDDSDLLGIEAHTAQGAIALGNSAYFAPLIVEAGAGSNAIWFGVDAAPELTQESVWLTADSLTAQQLIPLGVHFTATGGDFTEGVLLVTGEADDTVYVSDTFADTATGIATGGGSDHIIFSSNPGGAGNLDTIEGLVVVDAGTGSNYLHLDDRQATRGNAAVEVTSDTIVGFVGSHDTTPLVYLATGGTYAEIRLDGSQDSSVEETFRIVNPNGGLALYSHAGDEEISVESTSFATQIRAGKGDDTVLVGSGGNTLDAIQGPVAIVGQAGQDELVLYDQDSVAGVGYTIAPNTVMRSGAAEIGFTQVESVDLNMTSHDDYVNCYKVPEKTQFALFDSGGNDFLYGPNVSTDYELQGSDSGTLDGSMRFTAIENLWGGAMADRFLFSDSSYLSGAISGGLGRDTLDYSAATFDVRVNFPATQASLIHGVYDVENAIGGFGNDRLVGGVLNNRLSGGPGNDILIGGPGKDILHGDDGNDALIGDGGNDRLFGGVGRDLLIGGDGKDRLYGGDDDDILIDGTTSHDANVVALAMIMQDWSRTDLTYTQRIDRLRYGNLDEGRPVLDISSTSPEQTVYHDSAKDRLVGEAGRDWFFARLQSPGNDLLGDLETGEEVDW